MSSLFERFGQDEAPTAEEHVNQLSGVHEAPTQPAPYVEELDEGGAVGSIPAEGLYCLYEPVAELESGNVIGYEVHPRSETPGLEEPSELFSRAVFEHRVGELGRTIREQALATCAGVPVFLRVHAQELKEGWLIRPDDAIYTHDTEIFVQVAQPAFSSVCRQVLDEVRARGGISLCLDAFGGGQSNLLQLIELAPRYVKVDASLLRGIDNDQRRIRALYRTVQLCQDLGATVIAKGLTGGGERRVAMRCGVRLGQGPAIGLPQKR